MQHAATRTHGSSHVTGYRQPKAASQLTLATYVQIFKAGQKGTTLCISTAHLHTITHDFWACLFTTRAEYNLLCYPHFV